MKLKIAMLLLANVLLLNNCNKIFAQEKSSISNQTSASTCEEVKHRLDDSLYAAIKVKNSNIILIFRLGKGEESNTLISKRMYHFEKNLNFRAPSFKDIVLAQGTKNKGLGKVEIYIAGKLAWEIFMKKNKYYWDSCEE